MNSLLPQFVKLEPKAHKYFDTQGVEYKSVSSLLKLLHEPFDVEKRSYSTAQKYLRKELNREPSHDEILFKQKAVKLMWQQNNKKSIDIGHFVHDHLENYVKFGRNEISMGYQDISIQYGPASVNMAGLLAATPRIANEQLTGYQASFSEECIYSKKYLIAGTSDHLGIRSGGKRPVVDVNDYKTNASKGILFHSEYGNWMYEPISFLEDCNYTHYAIQLSLYAYMLEEHGFRPGRLKLIYVPPTDPEKYFPIAVNYMRTEVEMILDHLEATEQIQLRELVAA